MGGKKFIDIDGNYSEGGGQILRYALAFSCITKRPFLMTNIRKNRSKPGIKNQHLTAIDGLRQIYDANVSGDSLGSDYIEFNPKKLKSRNIEIDVGTAGSITLILQSIILPCIMEKKTFNIKITGGTDVPFSMQFDYMNNVVMPYYRKYADIEFKLIKRGYYPKGGGIVEVVIRPLKSYLIDEREKGEIQTQKPLEIDRDWEPISIIEQGHLMNIKGITHASTSLSDNQISERVANSAKNSLKKLINVHIQSVYAKSESESYGITLWALFSKNKFDIDQRKPIIIGTDLLGEKDIMPEKIGERAANKLIEEINSQCPIDIHLQDNIVPLIAMFGGQVRIDKITDHTKAAMYVATKFMGTPFFYDEEKLILSVTDPYHKEIITIDEI